MDKSLNSFNKETEKVDLKNTVVDEGQRLSKEVGGTSRLRQEKYSDVSPTMIVRPGKVMDFLLENQNARNIRDIDWMEVFESMKKQEETRHTKLAAKMAEFKAMQAQAKIIRSPSVSMRKTLKLVAAAGKRKRELHGSASITAEVKSRNNTSSASSSNGTGPSSATATSVGCHSQFHSRHRAAALWAATCRCQSIESDIGANLTTVANVISKDHVSINVRIQLTMIAFQNVDIVSGNKKLIIAFLWQLMRFSMLHLLKKLRTHGQGKDITDADIIHCENMKVKQSGKTQMDSFKVISNHL
ncbi:hypothetical protein SSX86_014595 [Deinandra increscens subsp. villosa]|uniref:Uncharacterized protein n=1 Tax=Deinandra increscens subsp. villosa TaxID=3103831 RepID=A0AAP0D9Q8_9ASTR